MALEKIELIRQSPTTAYNQLNRTDKKTLVLNSEFSIAFPKTELNSEFNLENLLIESKKLELMGYKPISLNHLIGAFAITIEDLDLTIPHNQYKNASDLDCLSKKEKKQIIQDQRDIFQSVFNSLEVSVSDNGEVLYLSKNSSTFETTNITPRINELLMNNPEIVMGLGSYQGIVNNSLDIIRKFIRNNKSSVMISQSPSQSFIEGPVISIGEKNELPFSWRKDSDSVVSDQSPDTLHFGVLRESIRHNQMRLQRDSLHESITQGQIKLLDEFKTENWPTHPLMSHIKKMAIPIIFDEIDKKKIVCDPQDARYQTIFRLTTYSIDQIFQNGECLQQYLIESGAYYDWRNILSLDSSYISEFKLNENLVRGIAREQLHIIDNRLNNSQLPVEDLLTPSGIFAEKGWVMQKEEGNVFAVQKDASGKEISRKNVIFKPVDSKLATEYHHAFHYIHTPRTGMAFGFYLEEGDLPFSVLALEPIDRSYKKNMLLMHGFDPKHCVDLARLYSRPGTPFNTSSTMFSMVFSELKTNNPETQAVLSAFMPTYASGMSMLSGGFDNPVLIKPNRHMFGRKIVNGLEVFEHLTKRRRFESTDFLNVHPTIPMLPVVELMTRLKKPRFEPFKEVNGKMVVCES